MGGGGGGGGGGRVSGISKSPVVEDWIVGVKRKGGWKGIGEGGRREITGRKPRGYTLSRFISFLFQGLLHNLQFAVIVSDFVSHP